MDNKLFFYVSWILIVTTVKCHRNGGPIEACRTMVPDHEGMEPLDGAHSNYYIEVEPQEDGSIEVVLEGGNFKGFFLQVRTQNGTDPEGTFEEHPKFRQRDCPDSHGNILENSSQTHRTHKNKSSVVTYWIPPDHSRDGDIFVFYATVVEKFDEVYVNITTTYELGSSTPKAMRRFGNE